MFGNTVQLNLGGTRSDESIAYTGHARLVQQHPLRRVPMKLGVIDSSLSHQTISRVGHEVASSVSEDAAAVPIATAKHEEPRRSHGRHAHYGRDAERRDDSPRCAERVSR